MTLTEDCQSNGESGTQVDNSRDSTSNSSSASSSGMGALGSIDSGTSNDGSTPTTSEGGSSNKNTQATGGLLSPLTQEDIPQLVRELARHFDTGNQFLLVPGMIVICDYKLHVLVDLIDMGSGIVSHGQTAFFLFVIVLIIYCCKCFFTHVQNSHCFYQ